jgi:hypothetical protein
MANVELREARVGLVKAARRALLVAVGVAGVLLAVAGGSASAAETCERAVGEGRFKIIPETDVIRNELSTNLAEPQKLVFFWENEKHRVTLKKLLGAVCSVGSNQKAFGGHGEATVDGEGGYFVRFRITVMNKGTLYVDVWIYKGKEFGEHVREFHDGALTEETIS